MRRRRHAARGTTLIEILLSIAIVLVGMLAMFGVLRSSIHGSATASRLGQAQARAVTILESIRQSPTAAFTCLVGATTAQWPNCEAICKQALTVPSQDACIYSMAAFSAIRTPSLQNAGQYDPNGQENDRNGQTYVLDPSSRIALAGANSSVYDVRIVVGWNDDNSGNTDSSRPGYHSVALRTGFPPAAQ